MSFEWLKSNWKVFSLLGSVAAVLAYGYFNIVDLSCIDSRINYQLGILNHTAIAPFRYRVLVPYLTEGWIQILSFFFSFSYRKSFVLAYAFFDFAAIFLLLATLFHYLKKWFSEERSLIGTLFAAGTMAVALRNHCFQPWSLLEPSLFTLGLLFIYKRRWILFSFLILLSALIRETTLFIPFLFLVTCVDFKSVRPLLLFGFFLSLWLIVAALLRHFYSMEAYPYHALGSLGYDVTFPQVWERNTEKFHFRAAIVHMSFFLGFFWLFAVAGFRRAAHPFLKKAVYILPIYFFPWVTYGTWFEVRLLMPLYPILIPLGLSYLYPKANS